MNVERIKALRSREISKNVNLNKLEKGGPKSVLKLSPKKR
jgi:hypothetical protein